MKYCFNCSKVTAGDPLFCNFCGASFEIKLCPRLHPNPRAAEVCSQCGSHDLSMPQPKVPLWGKVLIEVVPVLAAAIIGVISLALAAILAMEVRQHPMESILIAICIGALWWFWTEIPSLIRRSLYRFLKRKAGQR